MLHVHDLSFEYRQGVPVLHNIRFKATSGERVGIVGHSGSGKSTLIQLLAGLLTPQSGSIHWHGSLVSKHASNLIPGDPRVALVSQQDRLLHGFTVFEQMDHGLRTLLDADRTRRIQRLANVLGVQSLLERRPDTLSGGERQRVNLAVQLCKPAEVWLLDEPFTYLDAPMRRKIFSFLQTDRTLKQSLLILVSHVPDELFSFSDRILVMKQGRLLRNSTPYALYRTPRTRYEAGLLGECTELRNAETGLSTLYRPYDWEVCEAGLLTARVVSSTYTPHGYFTWMQAMAPFSGSFGIVLPQVCRTNDVLKLKPKTSPVWTPKLRVGQKHGQ